METFYGHILQRYLWEIHCCLEVGLNKHVGIITKFNKHANKKWWVGEQSNIYDAKMLCKGVQKV